jgi:hypothetical protein
MADVAAVLPEAVQRSKKTRSARRSASAFPAGVASGRSHAVTTLSRGVIERSLGKTQSRRCKARKPRIAGFGEAGATRARTACLVPNPILGREYAMMCVTRSR